MLSQLQSVSVISGTLVRGNDTTAAAATEPLGRHQSRAEEEEELRVMMKKK